MTAPHRGRDELVAYNLAMGTVCGYPAERLAPVKRQKIGDGPLMLVLPPAAEVNWFLNVTRKTLSGVGSDYRRYRSMVDDVCGVPSDFLAEVVDGLDDIFAQETLWETGGGSSVSDHDGLVTVMALQRLSKTVRTSYAALVDLIWNLVVDIESSRAATTET